VTESATSSVSTYRRRPARLLAIIVAFAAGLGIGWLLARQSGDDKGPFYPAGSNSTLRFDQQTLTPPQQRAAAFVLGATREGDTLTFGEWAKTRMIKQQCTEFSPAKIGIAVQIDGVYGKRVDWNVTLLIPEIVPAKCLSTKLENVEIGRFRSDKVAVESVANGWYSEFQTGREP
jgi:hypothetical protein